LLIDILYIYVLKYKSRINPYNMSKDPINQAHTSPEVEIAVPHDNQHAELSKAGGDVREDVSDALGDKEKLELSPEDADRLIGTLKDRFDAPANKKLRESLSWADVEKSLRVAPEKLYALQKLEETGGKPQLIGIDRDEFIFEDRSKESPSGRRNMNFDEAAAQAEEFGVDMQSPDAYKAMQLTGKYNLRSSCWLKTDPGYRKRTGLAVVGYRVVDNVYVYDEYDAVNPYPFRGWRASLRVKKV
jgi:hypothetical protein